eukprot:COSAG02_NODE_585_length_19988_cov_11.056061_2_plen_54_part_00
MAAAGRRPAHDTSVATTQDPHSLESGVTISDRQIEPQWSIKLPAKLMVVPMQT